LLLLLLLASFLVPLPPRYMRGPKAVFLSSPGGGERNLASPQARTGLAAGREQKNKI